VKSVSESADQSVRFVMIPGRNQPRTSAVANFRSATGQVRGSSRRNGQHLACQYNEAASASRRSQSDGTRSPTANEGHSDLLRQIPQSRPPFCDDSRPGSAATLRCDFRRREGASSSEARSPYVSFLFDTAPSPESTNRRSLPVLHRSVRQNQTASWRLAFTRGPAEKTFARDVQGLPDEDMGCPPRAGHGGAS